MEKVILKKLDLFEEVYSNREVKYTELIYDRYEHNSIQITIYPDDYQYRIRIFERINKDTGKGIKLHRYIIGAYPFEGEKSILLFEVSNKPLATTGKGKFKVKALFSYMFLEKKEKKESLYMPFLLVDQHSNELIIEKTLHDIFSSSAVPGEAEFKIRKRILEVYKKNR